MTDEAVASVESVLDQPLTMAVGSTAESQGETMGIPAPTATQEIIVLDYGGSVLTADRASCA